MKMTNGNHNNIEDISTDNLYKLLERAKGGDYEAQRQCIEKELITRLANEIKTKANYPTWKEFIS